MRLVPKNSEYTWACYSVLYFGFFFLDPIESHASARVWFFTLLGTAAFLPLYFGLFWVSCRQGLLHLAAMLALGAAFARYNGGATTFFIFAAACGPFVVDNEVDGFKVLAVVEAAGFLTWWAFHLNGWFLLFSNGLAFIIGISNIHFAQRNRTNKKLFRAQEEIEHLAKVAERERIARDLHDVLGHTLSVITLKSELASKLIDRDPQRAGQEIGEVERISRQALSEVRDAIRGYRSQGLVAELAQAKTTLETAGLVVQCDAATTVKLPAVQESVLSLAVREAVTNVLRHAQARTCRMRLEQIQHFIEEGGLMVTLGSGSMLALEGGLVRFVRRSSGGVPRSVAGGGGASSAASQQAATRTPGAHVRVTFDRADHPIAYGYPAHTYVFRQNFPLYNTPRRWLRMAYCATCLDGPEDRSGVVMEWGDSEGKAFVVSGQAWGEENLIGRPAILDMPVGKGHVVCFNFNPMHRDLNRGDQRLLWNAILNWQAIIAAHPRSDEGHQPAPEPEE